VVQLLFELFLVSASGLVVRKTQSTDWMYVLAYSWEAEFCYGTTYPGCSVPEDYWKTDFTVHGLWPQYTTSGYPQDCTTEAFDPKAPEAVGMDTMIEYWPNVQEEEGSADYDSFWEHEWTKHGTCSGLDQTTYFNSTINLIRLFGTPSVVSSNVGGTVSASSIRDALGGADHAALQCNGGKYLSGVFTCWSQVNGIPGTQQVCPTDVQGEDTCTSSDVEIASF